MQQVATWTHTRVSLEFGISTLSIHPLNVKFLQKYSFPENRSTSIENTFLFQYIVILRFGTVLMTKLFICSCTIHNIYTYLR